MLWNICLWSIILFRLAESYKNLIIVVEGWTKIIYGFNCILSFQQYIYRYWTFGKFEIISSQKYNCSNGERKINWNKHRIYGAYRANTTSKSIIKCNILYKIVWCCSRNVEVTPIIYIILTEDWNQYRYIIGWMEPEFLVV
jgi:hypothetical protein